MIERGGEVRARMVRDRTTLEAILAKNVDPMARVFTDSFVSYSRLDRRCRREWVDHNAIESVRGEVHTNGIENFWALLKRRLRGHVHRRSPLPP